MFAPFSFVTGGAVALLPPPTGVDFSEVLGGGGEPNTSLPTALSADLF